MESVHSAQSQCCGCCEMPPGYPFRCKEHIALAALGTMLLAIHAQLSAPSGPPYPVTRSSWDSPHSRTNHGHKGPGPSSQLGTVLKGHPDLRAPYRGPGSFPCVYTAAHLLPLPDPASSPQVLIRVLAEKCPEY